MRSSRRWWKLAILVPGVFLPATVTCEVPNVTIITAYPQEVVVDDGCGGCGGCWDCGDCGDCGGWGFDFWGWW